MEHVHIAKQEKRSRQKKKRNQDKVKHVKNNNELNFVLFSNFFNFIFQYNIFFKKKKEEKKPKKIWTNNIHKNVKPNDIFDFYLLSEKKGIVECCVTRNICVFLINNKLWTLYIWPIEPERRIKVLNFLKITIIGSI